MQLGVSGGVKGHLKQRHKDILQHFPKVLQKVLRAVDVTVRVHEQNQCFIGNICTRTCVLQYITYTYRDG